MDNKQETISKVVDPVYAVEFSGVHPFISLYAIKPQYMIKLSIIIVAWNTKEYSVQCLDSIFKFSPSCEFEVIYVDNGSDDGSADVVKGSFPDIKIIQNKCNIGFSKANNQAIRIAEGEYILLLNSDTVVLDGSFTKLLIFMEDNSNVGAASGKCLYPDGRVQWEIGEFPSIQSLLLWVLSRHRPLNKMTKFVKKNQNRKISQGQEQDHAYGAFCMVRKKTIDEVGLIDENMFVYYDEVDWCYRMK